jgi:hypothetical protein
MKIHSNLDGPIPKAKGNSMTESSKYGPKAINLFLDYSSKFGP